MDARPSHPHTVRQHIAETKRLQLALACIQARVQPMYAVLRDNASVSCGSFKSYLNVRLGWGILPHVEEATLFVVWYPAGDNSSTYSKYDSAPPELRDWAIRFLPDLVNHMQQLVSTQTKELSKTAGHVEAMLEILEAQSTES